MIVVNRRAHGRTFILRLISPAISYFHSLLHPAGNGGQRESLTGQCRHPGDKILAPSPTTPADTSAATPALGVAGGHRRVGGNPIAAIPEGGAADHHYKTAADAKP